MLYTNLKHIESADDYTQVINQNVNVVLICGTMDPISVRAYTLAESLVKGYKHVKFFDIEYDNPEFYEVRNLLHSNRNELPFVVLYRNGVAVYILHGIQTRDQLKKILNAQFGTKQTNSTDISIHN